MQENRRESLQYLYSNTQQNTLFSIFFILKLIMKNAFVLPEQHFLSQTLFNKQEPEFLFINFTTINQEEGESLGLHFFTYNREGCIWFSYYLILTSLWCQLFVCVWVTAGSVGMSPWWPHCAGNMLTEASLKFPSHYTTPFLSYFPTLALSCSLRRMKNGFTSSFVVFIPLSPLPLTPFDRLSSKTHSSFSFFLQSTGFISEFVSREEIQKQPHHLQMVYQPTSPTVSGVTATSLTSGNEWCGSNASNLAITCLFFQNKRFNKDTWVFDWRQFQQPHPLASDQQLYYQEFVNQGLDSCICLRKSFLAVDMRGRMDEPESRRKRERREGNKGKEMDDGKWKDTQVMTLVNRGRWWVGVSMEGGEGGKERQAEVKETPVFYSGLKKNM